MFNSPTGVAMDVAGTTVIVADWCNHLLRRVDVTSGLVTTLAGSVVGSNNYGHADGVGTAASFYYPYGVAMDAAGNSVIVADRFNNLVRRVNLTSGLVKTLAGNVVMAGGPPNNYGHADGAGAAASFYNPTGIAMDAAGGTIILADQNNHLLRRIDLATGLVTTPAGSPTQFGHADGSGTAATFYFPAGVAMDAAGTTVIIADYDNHLLRLLTIAPPSSSSQSGTISLTATQTSSGSPTAAATSSTSSSATTTASQTSCPTPSLSPTRSPSTTGTPSSSRSPTNTASRSGTFTPSITQTRSLSATFTSSSSESPTGTASQTGTFTPSLTQTRSPSATVTPSSTQSQTQSVSQSTSQAASISQTQTRSSSATPSATMTASNSPTRSLSWTPSPSATPSVTATQSVSESPTSSESASVTPSVTQTTTDSTSGTPSNTQSRTNTPSGTASPSQSATESTTAAISASPTRSASSSQSSSPSLSVSPSSVHAQSQAPSSSPRPIRLNITLGAVNLGSLRYPLFVTDAAPPFPLELTLGRCPVAVQGSPVTVACNATLSSASDVAFFAEEVPFATVALPQCSSRDGPVMLPMTVLLGLNAGTAAGTGTITCEVSVGDVGIARASVPVAASPALWPLWSDAIVVSDLGLARSTVLGKTVNATPALLLAACEGGVGSCPSGGSLESALASPRAVLDAVRATWAASPLSLSNQSESQAFSLTLVGQTRIVLRATRRAFNQTAVTLGSVAASMLSTSDDGNWVLLQTPSAAAVCVGVDASSDCGYFTLALSNPAPGQVNALCPPISCPPFCPGEQAAGTIPFVVNTSAGLQAVPAAFPAGVSPGTAAPAPLVLPALSSLGIYYARACSATGLWTDPATGACANGSDPRSYSCAYGSGDACVRCPDLAICPGGSRAWPRPGAWTASEAGGPAQVVSCLPPQSRCLGWNASVGASQRYSGLLYIVVAIVALVCVVYAFLAALVCFIGGTITGGLFRMSNLALWALTCAQVVSDAADVVSPSMPPLITRLYNAVAVLQFQSIFLPPACTGALPFETELLTMGAALACWGVAAAVYYASRLPLVRLGGQFVLLWAMALYPSTALIAAGLLSCSSVTLSAQGAAGLDGGQAFNAATASRNAVTSLSVLVSDPFFVCWAGHHRAPGILASLTLVVYVAGLPALTLWWLIRDPWVQSEARRATASAAAKAAAAGAGPSEPGDVIVGVDNPMSIGRGRGNRPLQPSSLPLGEPAPHPSATPPSPDSLLGVFFYDYKPSAWHTKHVDLGLLLLLSLFRALLPRPTTLGGVLAKTAVLCVALLGACVHVLWVRPYLEADAWMGWVRALLLIDSASIVALNAALLAGDIGFGGPGLSASASAGSIVIVALCVATLVVLLCGFGWHAFHIAESEQAVIEVAERAAAAAKFEIRGSRVHGSRVRDINIHGVSPEVHRDPESSASRRTLGDAFYNPLFPDTPAPEAGPGLSAVDSATRNSVADLHAGDAIGNTVMSVRSPIGERVASSGRRRRDESRRRADPLKSNPALAAAATVLTDASAGGSESEAASDFFVASLGRLPAEDSRAVAATLLSKLSARLEAACAADSADVAAAVCRAMAALSDHSDAATLTRLTSDGVPGQLAKLLQQIALSSESPPPLLAHVLWLLGNVAADEGAAEAFFRAGGAGSLVALLSVASEVAPGKTLSQAPDLWSDTTLHACVALASISEHIAAAAPLLDAGILTALARILHLQGTAPYPDSTVTGKPLAEAVGSLAVSEAASRTLANVLRCCAPGQGQPGHATQVCVELAACSGATAGCTALLLRVRDVALSSSTSLRVDSFDSATHASEALLYIASCAIAAAAASADGAVAASALAREAIAAGSEATVLAISHDVNSFSLAPTHHAGELASDGAVENLRRSLTDLAAALRPWLARYESPAA